MYQYNLLGSIIKYTNGDIQFTKILIYLGVFDD